MSSGISKYTPEITQFGLDTNAKAVDCFVIDGNRGTGGMPLVMGFPPPSEYKARCLELIRLLRRSAELLESDIKVDKPIVRCVSCNKQTDNSAEGRERHREECEYPPLRQQFR